MKYRNRETGEVVGAVYNWRGSLIFYKPMFKLFWFWITDPSLENMSARQFHATFEPIEDTDDE